jgi:hypothetical protein
VPASSWPARLRRCHRSPPAPHLRQTPTGVTARSAAAIATSTERPAGARRHRLAAICQTPQSATTQARQRRRRRSSSPTGRRPPARPLTATAEPMDPSRAGWSPSSLARTSATTRACYRVRGGQTDGTGLGRCCGDGAATGWPPGVGSHGRPGEANRPVGCRARPCRPATRTGPPSQPSGAGVDTSYCLPGLRTGSKVQDRATGPAGWF